MIRLKRFAPINNCLKGVVPSTLQLVVSWKTLFSKPCGHWFMHLVGGDVVVDGVRLSSEDGSTFHYADQLLGGIESVFFSR